MSACMHASMKSSFATDRTSLLLHRTSVPLCQYRESRKVARPLRLPPLHSVRSILSSVHTSTHLSAYLQSISLSILDLFIFMHVPAFSLPMCLSAFNLYLTRVSSISLFIFDLIVIYLQTLSLYLSVYLFLFSC